MAGPYACQSSCQNLLPTGKDELAEAAPGPIPTNDNRTSIHTPIVSRVSIPAPARLPAPIKSTARYSKENFQRIFKIVLEARAPILALQPLVFPNEPLTRPLKARFPNLYCGKTHMECYNFCQECKDYFAIAEAKKHNRVSFAITFFQDQALFW